MGSSKVQGGSLSLQCIEPNAAGIDVGATEIYVAVPADRDAQPVRCFATFTQDLQAMTAWLLQCGIVTVAMESTGVYWIPVYEGLEDAGLRVCLVNSRHVKHVPGRKSDVSDCQWLQYLHSVGLLRAAFRPGQDVCAVRTVLRHRNELVAAASQHVQHMHKALTQMNLQIHHVISDITGSTGRAIVDAILADNGTAPIWPSCGIHISKPTPRPSENRWKATGGPSICLPSVNREICTASISNRS